MWSLVTARGVSSAIPVRRTLTAVRRSLAEPGVAAADLRSTSVPITSTSTVSGAGNRRPCRLLEPPTFGSLIDLTLGGLRSRRAQAIPRIAEGNPCVEAAHGVDANPYGSRRDF